MPWHAAGVAVGRVHVDRVARLAGVCERSPAGLTLPGRDFDERSDRLAQLVAALADAGEIRTPTGELYPVGLAHDAPLLHVDRAAVPWLGVRAFGVHLNGWQRRPDGLHLWVAVRARGKSTFPGHLDNLVAGGQGIGWTAVDTLRKECGEEAGLPPDLAALARPAAAITYEQQDGRSLKVDTLQCFDLELPASFTPRPVDGEVESFRLSPVAEVARSLRERDLWKPNSALVALDFLLRNDALDDLAADERQCLWAALHARG